MTTPLSELLICTTTSTDPIEAVLTVHDLHTLSQYATFRQCSADGHATSFIPSTQQVNGLILSAQSDKALIHAYMWNREQLHMRMILPERLSALQTSSSGIYAIGGTHDGRLYIWETSTGRLHRSFDAHYRKVSTIRFASDDSVIISASDDASVKIWLIASLLDADNDSPEPLATWSEHTLPISDVVIGLGSYASCRVFTASLDSTVKIWELATNTLLTTFVFPAAITCLAIDPVERHIYAGSKDGTIYQTDLYTKREGKAGYNAVGGGGDLISSSQKTFVGHSKAISSICLSFDTSLLVSAAGSEAIMIWDTVSRQCLKTLSSIKAPISHVAVMLKPPEFMADGTAPQRSSRPIAAFQRMIAQRKPIPSAAEARSDPWVEIDGKHCKLSPDYHEQIQSEISYFLRPATESMPSQVQLADMQKRLDEMEKSHTVLQARYSTLKSANDQLWEKTVKHVLASDTAEKSK